ncbi:MAG: Gfo/Idh/MocA family oxidoreductase, partial [Gemmatimonadota bacterium]
MTPVHLAVVGCGQIAGAHLGAIAALGDARLTWTQDILQERADAAAARFGAARCTTSYEEVLSAPTGAAAVPGGLPPVDAVLLCLPHDLHLAFAVAAARAGKHVLVEKPMALTEAEGREMVRAAEAAGVVLAVGQSTRCFPTFQRARSLIAADALGEVRHVAVQRLFYVDKLSTDWRRDVAACGGLYLPIFGSHDVDALLWLLDESPTRVTAAVRAFTHASGGDSDGYLGLEFADGKVASVQFSLCARTSRQEFVVVGTEGTLVIGRGQLWRDHEEVAVGQTEDSFALQTRLFVEAVQGRRPPFAPGREVLRVLRTLDLARKA